MSSSIASEFTTKSAEAVSKKETLFLAGRICELVRLIDPPDAGRVLLVEPSSPLLVQTLRALGFAGEVDALVRRPHGLLAVSGGIYGKRFEGDWPKWLAPARRTPADTPAPSGAGGAALASLPGTYHIVVVCDPLRHLSAATMRRRLLTLLPFVELRGFMQFGQHSAQRLNTQLVKRFFMHTAVDNRLESCLLEHGAVRASDLHQGVVHGGVAWTLVQRHSAEEARQIGLIRRVTRSQLDRDACLQASLVHAYRESFAGSDWREWTRCSRPACGRHYSREEAALLDPPDRCVCGWHRPLELFHTPASIRHKLRTELAANRESCCFLRLSGDRVDGFSWGYLSDVAAVVDSLVAEPHQAVALSERMGQLLASASASDGPCSVYYHSELGVLETGRSLSLLRAILQRGLQFAYDRGARVAISRTSRQSRIYPIVIGLGMRELLSYATESPSAPPVACNAAANHPSDGTIPDARVVLGGDLEAILRMFMTSSDRRMAMRIAHTLRQIRQSTANDVLSYPDGAFSS